MRPAPGHDGECLGRRRNLRSSSNEEPHVDGIVVGCLKDVRIDRWCKRADQRPRRVNGPLHFDLHTVRVIALAQPPSDHHVAFTLFDRHIGWRRDAYACERPSHAVVRGITIVVSPYGDFNGVHARGEDLISGERDGIDGACFQQRHRDRLVKRRIHLADPRDATANFGISDVAHTVVQQQYAGPYRRWHRTVNLGGDDVDHSGIGICLNAEDGIRHIGDLSIFERHDTHTRRGRRRVRNAPRLCLLGCINIEAHV